MKTLLTRIKSTLQDDATLSTYVKRVEIHAPSLLPPTLYTNIPFIGVAPIDSPEVWVSSAKKEISLGVEVTLVYDLLIEETAIIGDTDNKGMIQFVEDVKTALRKNVFASGGTNYLSKPCDIAKVEYSAGDLGDNRYMIVAVITLDCRKLIVD